MDAFGASFGGIVSHKPLKPPYGPPAAFFEKPSFAYQSHLNAKQPFSAFRPLVCNPSLPPLPLPRTQSLAAGLANRWGEGAPRPFGCFFASVSHGEELGLSVVVWPALLVVA